VIARLRTESDRPKIKPSTSLYVGDVKNSSWSFGDRMRRTGWEYSWAERLGGEGKGGVIGVGSREELVWDRRLLLDRSWDSFLDRSRWPACGGREVDAMVNSVG
jgi:hypothetical protein